MVTTSGRILPIYLKATLSMDSYSCKMDQVYSEHEHTGKHVVPSTLRSSFVTCLLDGDVTTNEATIKGSNSKYQLNVGNSTWQDAHFSSWHWISFKVILVYPSYLFILLWNVIVLQFVHSCNVSLPLFLTTWNISSKHVIFQFSYKICK